MQQVQKTTIPRRVTQLAFFVLTGQWLAIGWLRCPFGVPFVSCGSCPLTDCRGTWLQTWFIGLIVAAGVVIGRAFCGWACPMGLLGDVLGRLPKPRIDATAWFRAVDPYLRVLKYVVLALVVYATIVMNYPADRAHPYVVRNPSAFSLEAAWIGTQLGADFYANRIAILVGVLILSLVIVRAWCRYLCPLGAILGLFNKISLLRVRKEEHECEDCGRYPRECLQHTVPDTTECVICGDCIPGCSKGAVRIAPALRRQGSAGGSEAV